MLSCLCAGLRAQVQTGSIRGVVLDADLDAPLADARVRVVETGLEARTTDQGNYLLSDLAPGTYTLSFGKAGFLGQLRGDVLVVAGRLSEADVALEGDFEEMPEFVVQDVRLGGSEADLLALRVESPQLVDSIGADVMSRAGAGDAASALRLVPGATVSNGKFAVIRGLPDRYVSSQINGVRLPSADEDTRAVELDQFPSVVIESIQVSKTFTPDQQSDASGGAVDLRLKSIPDEEPFLRFSTQYSQNSNVAGRDDFLSYQGGGVDTLGKDSPGIPYAKLGSNWDGAVGAETENAPTDFKWSLATGGKQRLRNGLKVGGFASVFYERDSSHIEDGVDDSYWVFSPGDPMTPLTKQGTPGGGDFLTALFDIQRSSRSVNWGGLGSVGVESENHQLSLTYLYTRSAEDTVTVATDTRGKAFYFPGYDPDDPQGPGNSPLENTAAPYLRTETLEYTERTTHTLQLSGKHAFPIDDVGLGPFRFTRPELEWSIAQSSADLDQPDKRQFGATWTAPAYNSGFPPFILPYVSPATWGKFTPAANINLGNLQRIWKTIEERSDQYAVSARFPFTQWGREEGAFKVGLFDDHVERDFDQDSFSNFNDGNSTFEGGFDDPWSEVFPSQDHPITGSDFDVDYHGEQDISAWYAMIDLPLNSWLTLITGARVERTSIEVINDPEELALWVPPGGTTQFELNPGDADVDFEQRDLLPMIGLEVQASEDVTVRGSFSQTVARQTFKELTPIQQQEYLGGPVFVGNPTLEMSEIVNYDLRTDYTPSGSSLVSLSLFKKNIRDPIEQVQRIADFSYETAENYPKGVLQGWEFELRQGLGEHWEALDGLSVGGNITRITSEVDLPAKESKEFADPSIDLKLESRDMTNAPDFLYNLYTTYDMERTQLSLYWTVKGDTLVAGAGQSNGNFVPNVYAKEFGTLNLGVSHQLGASSRVRFSAKNLTDPEIEEVFRFQGAEKTRSSYTLGREYSISLSGRF